MLRLFKLKITWVLSVPPPSSSSSSVSVIPQSLNCTWASLHLKLVDKMPDSQQVYVLLSCNGCTAFWEGLIPLLTYLKCFASYFALPSLGSSPSDDDEGDGEGPDWGAVWWLGNRFPPWVESYGADQSVKPILPVSESLRSWDGGGAFWNIGLEPGPYWAFW